MTRSDQINCDEEISGKPSQITPGRLKNFLRKSPEEKITSLRWVVRNLITGIGDRIRTWFCNLSFDTFSWGPTGTKSTYLAYYPDGLRFFPDLSDLYRRWIRGNKLNNNGDGARFIGLILNLHQIQEERIEGDLAELGVWKGNSAAILAHFAAESGKKLFLFDTFSGFDSRNIVGVDQNSKLFFADTSIDYARETIGHPGIVTYLKGFFPDTITEEVRSRTFALAHIDCDLYEPMKAALEFFYEHMPKGGMLILHDYSSGFWVGATRAIDEFCKAKGEFVSLWPDKSGTAVIRKSH